MSSNISSSIGLSFWLCLYGISLLHIYTYIHTYIDVSSIDIAFDEYEKPWTVALHVRLQCTFTHTQINLQAGASKEAVWRAAGKRERKGGGWRRKRGSEGGTGGVEEKAMSIQGKLNACCRQGKKGLEPLRERASLSRPVTGLLSKRRLLSRMLMRPAL